MSFNTAYIINPSKNELIMDHNLTITENGRHYIGQTAGRNNQTIVDLSKYSSISLTVDVAKGESVGEIILVFYSKSGILTQYYPYDIPNQNTDPNVIRVIQIANDNNENQLSLNLNSDNYSFLQNLGVGLTFFLLSPKVGANIKVKVWGHK